jgi:hypothetical protein
LAHWPALPPHAGFFIPLAVPVRDSAIGRVEQRATNRRWPTHNTALTSSIGKVRLSDWLLSLGKRGPEHRQTASRFGFGHFILQNIPVLGLLAIFKGISWQLRLIEHGHSIARLLSGIQKLVAIVVPLIEPYPAEGEYVVIVSSAEAVQHGEIADAIFHCAQRTVVAHQIGNRSCHRVHMSVRGYLAEMASRNCVRRDNFALARIRRVWLRYANFCFVYPFDHLCSGPVIVRCTLFSHSRSAI